MVEPSVLLTRFSEPTIPYEPPSRSREYRS